MPYLFLIQYIKNTCTVRYRYFLYQSIFTFFVLLIAD